MQVQLVWFATAMFRLGKHFRFSMNSSINCNCILQNIRSMRKNLDLLLANVNALDTEFDIIFLTETWISSAEVGEYKLDDYTFFANCNDRYRAGGVALFIKSSLNFEVSSVKFSSADIIKLTIQLGSKKFTFILIYRLQFYSVDVFLNELNELLVHDKSKHRILLGDLNIDLQKDAKYRDDYLLLCAYFGLEI